MLTEHQVLQLLQRAALLSSWPVLPADRGQALEKARVWAEQLDDRLTFDQAVAIVDRHCREERLPLAIVDLNEPVQRRGPSSQPRHTSTGAVQMLKDLERGAVPCPPDVDLHRYRGVQPKHRRRRSTAPNTKTQDLEFQKVGGTEPGHQDVGEQLVDRATPSAIADPGEASGIGA